MISVELSTTRISMSHKTSDAKEAPMAGFSLGKTDLEEYDIVYRASQHVWEPFHLCLPDDMSPLDDDDDDDYEDFAFEKTRVAQPPPIYPLWHTKAQYIFFDDQPDGQETIWPPRLVPVYVPKPRVPLGPVRAAFEVYASTTTLSEVELTPLDRMYTDENIPPTPAPTPVFFPFVPFDDDEEDEGDDEENKPAIPAPHARNSRRVFGVLHEDGIDREPVSPGGSDVSASSSAKGWARLRPKAPARIKIVSLKDINDRSRVIGTSGKSALSEKVGEGAGEGLSSMSSNPAGAPAPNAPIMATIPLPLVSGGSAKDL